MISLIHTIIFGAELIITLAFPAFVVYSIRKSKKERQLHELEKNELQKKLHAQGIKSYEAIVEEIGKELHDNVNQMLLTAKLFLDLEVDTADPQIKAELIDKSRIMIRDTMEEIRRLTRAMLPGLEHTSLPEAMNEGVELFKNATGMGITFDVKGLPYEVSREKKFMIYRIFQECMTNVIKHSGATSAKIVLVFEEPHLFLSIQDDGKGFQPTVTKKGVGLRNIKSRAELIEGKLDITSEPGAGTRINLKV